jgi:hypothetical protein
MMEGGFTTVTGREIAAGLIIITAGTAGGIAIATVTGTMTGTATTTATSNA